VSLIKFHHFNPSTLNEAFELLQKYGTDAKVIAGGVDLVNALKHELISPKVLINLKTVSGLSEIIEDEKKGLSIGALVTIFQMKNHSLVRERYPMLSQALDKIAVVPIQTMATIGGNLCQNTRCLYYNQSAFWRKGKPSCFKMGGKICNAVPGSDHCHAVHQGDAAPILIALGATAKIAGDGKERRVPLKDFFTGRGEKPNILTPREILTEIEIPHPPSDLVSGYEKFSIRGAMDYPLAGVAVAIFSDRIMMVLNGVDSSPVEVEEIFTDSKRRKIELPMIEKLIQVAMNKVHPAPNTDTTPSHRKKMVGVLLRRLLERR